MATRNEIRGELDGSVCVQWGGNSLKLIVQGACRTWFWRYAKSSCKNFGKGIALVVQKMAGGGVVFGSRGRALETSSLGSGRDLGSFVLVSMILSRVTTTRQSLTPGIRRRGALGK